MKSTKGLMLGDYVSLNGATKVVTSIPHEHSVALETPGQIYGTIYDTTPVVDVEPIKITIQMLEHNGFKKGINTYYHQYDGEYYPVPFFIEYVYDSFCLFINEGLVPQPIQYVHELQHAMRLCGIKEEFEL